LSTAADLLWYARNLRNVSRLVHRPLTPGAGHDLIRRLMETREERFLASAARYIYGHSRSPYLPLLRLAGCDYADLAAMVHQKGLERTLEALRDEGVWFSFEQFKGRQEVTRGGRMFRFAEGDFDNPFLRAGFQTTTGGSRSRGSPISIGLKFLEENFVPAIFLGLTALQVADLPTVLWSGGVGFIPLPLSFLNVGSPLARWFTMHDPGEPTVTARQRVLPTLARIIGLSRGVRIAAPEFAPVSAVDTVLSSLLDLRRRHGGCVITTSPSAAVRLVAAARRRGETLAGVTVLSGYEPLTATRAEEIRGAGARLGSIYAFSEGGVVGAACGDPQAADDMHFVACNMALVQHRRSMPEVGELNAFMFTSLGSLPPKILLNVESDDFGQVTLRRCGCPLDELGLHRHVAMVRSFTKLTAQGSTILGTDCVRILEEVLPREFGGRSVDYQLLEVEDEEHLTRLLLLVSPEVGPVDEQRVRQVFVDELRRTTSQGLRIWRQAEAVRVVRRDPVPTPRGKVLPFHTMAFAAFLRGGPAAGAPASGESPGLREASPARPT
jgi:hypothetical protein